MLVGYILSEKLKVNLTAAAEIILKTFPLRVIQTPDADLEASTL